MRDYSHHAYGMAVVLFIYTILSHENRETCALKIVAETFFRRGQLPPLRSRSADKGNGLFRRKDFRRTDLEQRQRRTTGRKVEVAGVDGHRSVQCFGDGEVVIAVRFEHSAPAHREHLRRTLARDRAGDGKHVIIAAVPRQRAVKYQVFDGEQYLRLIVVRQPAPFSVASAAQAEWPERPPQNATALQTGLARQFY